MKILLTGANGLLGQKLCSLLMQQNELSFLATGKGHNRMSFLPDAQYKEMDICNEEQVKMVMDNYQPTIVIHGAAMTQVDNCEVNPSKALDVNLQGTQNLVKSAERIGAFFIYISTDFVFDGNGKGMYTELDQPNPINFYGKSKLQAEECVQQSALKWAIVRTVLVFGLVEDGSRSNIILWVKKSLESSKAIRVVADQWRTPTLAEDLAIGCWLIAQKQAAGIFNICGEDWLCPYDMAIQTAEFFQLDPSLISATNASEFKEVGKRPLKTGLDISKAKQELGYKPHSFQEGLAILAEQLMANSLK